MAGDYWQKLNEYSDRFGQNFVEQQVAKRKQQKEFQQALQMYLFKQQYEQQMGLEKMKQEAMFKQQDPAYQMNQMRLAQALENMQKQAQFNKMAGMAYGNEPGQLNQPVAQMGGRVVPFRQTIQAQGTPALQFRRGFEQAGQTLVPSATGWSRANQPRALQPQQPKPPKPPSYNEQFRMDLQDATQRMMEGEDGEEITSEMFRKYPSSMTNQIQYNLRQIAIKARQKNLGLRTEAIRALKQEKFPVTENNIKAAMKQLRGQ